MKALSIKEPWASQILSGEKTIETRTWRTDYRGVLLLCASRRPAGPISGHAFATAELVDCRPMTVADQRAACCDVYPGAFSWVLRNVTPIEKFPVTGRLRLFDVEVEL